MCGAVQRPPGAPHIAVPDAKMNFIKKGFPTRRIEICSIGPLPEVDHDSESAPDPTDETITIEEGDCILA